MTGSSMHKADFGKVAVLMGGNSAERDISLLSGSAVLKSLLKSGIDGFAIDTGGNLIAALQGQDFDSALIMLHGKNGEDGKAQAVLELMNLPYTGSGVLASALAMDKVRSKQLWLASGLSTPDFRMLDKDSDWDRAIHELGGCFVKPVSEGSSIGISFAETAQDLAAAYESAARYDSRVMAERWIKGSEYSVSILGDQVLPVIELKTKNRFYDYDAKYEAEDTQYICPAHLDDKQTREIQELSKAAYEVVGCHGWGRVDLMRDQEGKFWLLEVNTVPGMTSHSLVPMSAKAAGMDFDELVMKILFSSVTRRGA